MYTRSPVLGKSVPLGVVDAVLYVVGTARRRMLRALCRIRPRSAVAMAAAFSIKKVAGLLPMLRSAIANTCSPLPFASLRPSRLPPGA